jgi:PAS domain S-box-containing protein
MIPRESRRKKRAESNAQLKLRLARCEATIRAIRAGEIDALVVRERTGDRVYTLDGAVHVYRVLIETMSEGAAALDRSGIILFGNRQLAEMIGVSTEQAIGRHFQSFLDGRHRAAFDEQLTNVATSTLSLNVELMSADGTRRPVHISTGVLELGDVSGICLVATDLSRQATYERELAEKAQELARSNSELERFAYVASHDLQEPLRMVGGFTQLLVKRYRGQLDSNADKFMDFIVDGVSRMKSLITDLLEYARVGADNCPFTNFPLEVPLSRALANLQSGISETGCMVDQGPLPSVWGDPAQLERLFQNLIGNSIKFRGEAPPRVTVRSERLVDRWVISVMDNGIGIEPRHFDRVFVLFQRLNDRAQYPGTGIGLTICKKIVERHGGTIWIDSQPGAGTGFHFTIPIRGDFGHESGGTEAIGHDPTRR